MRKVTVAMILFPGFQLLDIAGPRDAFAEVRILNVKDVNVYTTAGVTAGIDLALVMIEEDFGKQMALDVAKYLIVYVRRAGGQSQFSPLFETQASDNTMMQDIQRYLLDNLHLDHSAESLAKRVDMSPRNLSRIFSRECGAGLIAFLNDARIDAARRLLESTSHTVAEIAKRCAGHSREDCTSARLNTAIASSPVTRWAGSEKAGSRFARLRDHVPDEEA